MQLTDAELRDVLTRAEEIQRLSRHAGDVNAEMEVVIGAAEAIGLTRRAVEQALRERLNLPAEPPAPGTLVFATSADGKAYAAEVLSLSPDGVRVRFLRGSEHVVRLDEVRPCSLIPGERVACNWPYWGPWTCSVVSYDAQQQRVKLSDGWGSTHKFSLSEVWLAPPRMSDAPESAWRRRTLRLLAVGAGLGALVSSIATALLIR